MSQDFSPIIKEEPEWEDYCISEAQARGRVKLEPTLKPPSAPVTTLDTNSTTDNSTYRLNPINTIDKEKNTNSVQIKEERSEPRSQECVDLYKDSNEENPNLWVVLDSGSPVKVEISVESKCKAANKEAQVVISRRDLIAINNVAQEVNRKRVLQLPTDKEKSVTSQPVIINKCANKSKKPVISTKTNSLHKTRDLCNAQISQLDMIKKYINNDNKQPAMPGKTNCLQEVRNLCKIFIINPELSEQSPILMTNSLLKTKQIPNSEPKTQSVILSESITKTSPIAFTKSTKPQIQCDTKPTQIVPKTISQIPAGLYQPTAQLPINIAHHINVPISRLQGKVKPLNRTKIVTKTPNSQSDIIKSQPGTSTFKVFKPVETSESPSAKPTQQRGSVPKLQPKHNTGTILKLLNNLQSKDLNILGNGTVPILQSTTISKLKQLTTPSSKSVTESSQPLPKPNILNGKLMSAQSSLSLGLNLQTTVELNFQKLPNENSNVSLNLDGTKDAQKNSTSGTLKSNTSVTPGAPVNVQRIAPKPIEKLTSLHHSHDPKPIDSNPTTKVPNLQRITPKPISKLIGNSRSPTPIENKLLLKIENRDLWSELTHISNSNIELIESKLPKPVDSDLSDISDVIANSAIFQNICDSHQPEVTKLTHPSFMQPMPKPNNLIHQNNDTPQTGPLKSNTSAIATKSPLSMNPINFQRIAPKAISELTGNCRIPNPNDNNVLSKNKNNIRRPQKYPNIQIKAPNEVKSEIIEISDSLSRNRNDDQLAARPKFSYSRKPPLKHAKFSSSIDNNVPGNDNGQPELTRSTTNVSSIPLHKPLQKFQNSMNSISESIVNKCIPQSDDRPELTQTKKNTQQSNKAPNLEDFLKPSKVVLERMKKRHCKICQNIFYENRALVAHMRTHSACERPALYYFDLTTESPPNSVTCKYCPKRCTNSSSMYRHILRFHQPKKYQCDYCQKKFTERTSIINHIRTHTGEKPYRCKICKTHYRTQSNLCSHNNAVHYKTITDQSQSTKKHYCPICDMPFRMAAILNRHMKTHTGERPHVCVICKKKYIEKHHLQRHMDSHADKREFSCKICKYRFLRKSHLARHEKTHARNRGKTGRKVPKKVLKSRTS